METARLMHTAIPSYTQTTCGVKCKKNDGFLHIHFKLLPADVGAERVTGANSSRRSAAGLDKIE